MQKAGRGAGATAGLVALLILVLVGAGAHGTSAGQTASGAAPSLVEQRLVEIPGMQILSLSPDGQWLLAMTYWESVGRGADRGAPLAKKQGEEATEEPEDDRDRLCVYAVETLAERACADLAPLEAGLRVEDLAWSPDSTRIALTERSFVVFRDGDLWVMDAATGDLSNVTDDGFGGERLPVFDDDASAATIYLDVNPAWSPDSRSLAFSRTTIADGEFGGNALAVVDAAGGEPRQLLMVAPDEPGIVYYGIRWAPDGRGIYYTVSHLDADDPDNGIWFVAADGTGARQILGTTDPDLGFPSVGQISARGDYLLAFYPNAAARFVFRGPLYAVVDLATGTATDLTPGDPNASVGSVVSLATISPDGAWLLTVIRQPEEDARVVVRAIAGGDEQMLGDPLSGAVQIGVGLGPFWAADGTVLISRDRQRGTLLMVAGGGVAPPSASPVASPTGSPATADRPVGGEIGPGATVEVNDDNVALRSAPSRDAPIVLELARGTVLEVIGAAEEGDGFVWWPVREPETRSVGYVRAEFVDAV